MKKKFLSIFIIFIYLFFIPVSSVKAEGDIGIIKDIFRDENLRNEIRLIFNKKDDDFITKEEAEKVSFLFLKNKDIENIQGIEIFTNIESLNLAGNKIKEIPDTIGLLQKLQVINLDNNKITELPEELGKLTSLKELTLRSNALKELPEKLGFLINLRKLDIGNNFLEELPKEIRGLVNLEIILAGENMIASLPEEMGALKKLMILDLGSNKLKKIEAFFSDLDNLYFIDLSNNNIFDFDLKAYNKITSVEGYFNLANQNEKVEASTKGLKERDYSLALLKILKFDLDYDIEYYLASPNGEKEKISVDLLENSLVIPGEYLKETGRYSLNIHIIDRGFNTLGSSLEGQKGSIYKVEFTVDEVAALPIKNINKYLLISTGAVAAGLLILITARLVRRKN